MSDKYENFRSCQKPVQDPEDEAIQNILRDMRVNEIIVSNPFAIRKLKEEIYCILKDEGIDISSSKYFETAKIVKETIRKRIEVYGDGSISFFVNNKWQEMEDDSGHMKRKNRQVTYSRHTQSTERFYPNSIEINTVDMNIDINGEESPKKVEKTQKKEFVTQDGIEWMEITEKVEGTINRYAVENLESAFGMHIDDVDRTERTTKVRGENECMGGTIIKKKGPNGELVTDERNPLEPGGDQSLVQ